jgi:predicted transcriptional regulator
MKSSVCSAVTPTSRYDKSWRGISMRKTGFVDAVRRGEEALQRGDHLTHEQVGQRLEWFLQP